MPWWFEQLLFNKVKLTKIIYDSYNGDRNQRDHKYRVQSTDLSDERNLLFRWQPNYSHVFDCSHVFLKIAQLTCWRPVHCMGIHHDFRCVLRFGARGNCSLYWYLESCCPSVFKLSFHNIWIRITSSDFSI